MLSVLDYFIASWSSTYMKNVNVTDWLPQTTDISKYFVWSSWLWDKESCLDMLCVLIRIALPCRGDSDKYQQHTFLWRTDENYPSIIIKYPPYLFHWYFHEKLKLSLFHSYFLIDMYIIHTINLIWLHQYKCLLSLFEFQSEWGPLSFNIFGKYKLRHDKTNKVSVHPVKTQISLGIRPVWSESSLSLWRKLGFLATKWALSEDSDQTGWMPRLICVFAGRTVILLDLIWGGSYLEHIIILFTIGIPEFQKLPMVQIGYQWYLLISPAPKGDCKC